MSKTEKEVCFVIMPISDSIDYVEGHFRHVYEDIFKPSIEAAGYIAKRADDDKASSMIHVNIINDIINAPMAICDLSSRNPNVLFELGIRQAYDLPVVLINETDTPKIFDISTINTIEYRKELIYHEVLEDREKIKKSIEETRDNRGLNSIIKLLEIGKKAAEVNTGKNLTENEEIKLLLYSIQNQVDALKNKNTSSNDFIIEANNYDFYKSNLHSTGHGELPPVEIIISEIERIYSKFGENTASDLIKKYTDLIKKNTFMNNSSKNVYLNNIYKVQLKLGLNN